MKPEIGIPDEAWRRRQRDVYTQIIVEHERAKRKEERRLATAAATSTSK